MSISATANQSKRTFTIRKSKNGKTYSKYRTYQMSKIEFEDSEMFTCADWSDFLKHRSYIALK